MTEQRERESLVYLGDFEFVEDILKDLVVLNHLVLVLCIEINLVHGHDPWMSGVQKLAMNRTGTSLKIETALASE